MCFMFKNVDDLLLCGHYVGIWAYVEDILLK